MALFLYAEMEGKEMYKKKMSQCHKKLTKPVKSSVRARDKGYGKPCHAVSQCHNSYDLHTPSHQEGRGGSRSEGKHPLGGVPHIERTLEEVA